MAEVECHNCGTAVEKPPHKIERNDRHFCSTDCYHESGRPDMAGSDNPNPEKEKVSVECESCSGSFKVHEYRKDTARFCCRECKDDFMRGRSGQGTPRWKAAKGTFTCEECGDEFQEYPYRNDRKYCSKSCFSKSLEERFSGDGNPAWRGGFSNNYGPNWDEQREKAILRDGRECQRCGLEESDADAALHVHHQTRLGWFKEEYDAPEWYEKANRLENLTTLCRSCHMKEEWSNDAIQPE